jgi:PAS domain S-box-containing protein
MNAPAGAWLLPRLSRAAHLAYGLVACISALAISGWLFDIQRLRDFGADFPPMAPAAALAFLLVTCSFLLSERQDGRSRRAALIAAGAAVALALLTLLELAAGIALGMNFPFLARSEHGYLPAPMSATACMVIILLALAAPLRRELRLGGVSASALVAGVTGSVAFFALLGLSLRILRFDIAAPLLGLSLPEGLAALLAALGLLAARPSAWLLDTMTSRRTGAVMTRWLLPAAFGVPLAVGWMRLLAEREGLISEAFGVALFTLLMIASFSALILWVARTLDRIAAQRAQAEEQADEQREWLQVTLGSVGDGVIATDAAGRVHFLNKAAQRFTGWGATEAEGRPITQLLQLFDERDGSAIENPLRKALHSHGASAASGEPALRARDGSVRSLDVNAAPIIDAGDGLLGGVLVLREASARRQAERAMREAYTELDQRVVRRTAALERASAALRERNALLNAITTSTPDLIFAKDRAGRALMANPAWIRAVGKMDNDVMGLDESDRMVLDSGEAMIIEAVLPGEAGSERTYLTTKSPLRDEQGRIIGLIGVATDITERKHAQRELEKLVVAEQRLRAEAERANRAKDEFLAIVSHELRSPLNALRGWSHILATTQPLEPPLLERAAKAIKRNVDHQTRLIDDLLDTSRIVSGKLNIERRMVNLVDVLLAALDTARPGAVIKKIELRFEPEEPAVMVLGDAGRLQQLASNLLSNAVKFTQEGGRVDVSLSRTEQGVRLTVRDNGIGIAPDFLPHVFDRFSQADTSSARRAGGLGIGLALVRHIAVLHGGQVRAESQGPGRGSAFIVELPAAAPLALAATPQAEFGGGAERRRGAEKPLAQVRIWVADDDPDAHEVVGLTLRQAGALVRSFSGGAELLAALEAAVRDEAPEVLLLDLGMPGQDGFEVLRLVRALETARGAHGVTPAIALTAFTQIERERLAKAGFRDRVDKPVDADRLIAAIHAALKERSEPLRALHGS